MLVTSGDLGSSQSQNVGILWLILSRSFHAGSNARDTFVLTVSPHWNANEAHEGIVHADESDRTNPKRHQIG
jgi:hypothetical protein